MLKMDEFMKEGSCFNRAERDEMLFVLLARDESAPVAVRAWIQHRLLSGKNKETDAQIIEARAVADSMEKYRRDGLHNRRNNK